MGQPLALPQRIQMHGRNRVRRAPLRTSSCFLARIATIGPSVLLKHRQADLLCNNSLVASIAPNAQDRHASHSQLCMRATRPFRRVFRQIVPKQPHVTTEQTHRCIRGASAQPIIPRAKESADGSMMHTYGEHAPRAREQSPMPHHQKNPATKSAHWSPLLPNIP